MWLPLKLIARVAFATLGAVGLSSTAVQSASQSLSEDISTTLQQAATAVVTGTTASSSTVWEQQPSAPTESDRVIDKIAEMVEETQEQGTNVDDVTPEERERQAKLPRNTKKRMFEREKEEALRDEL